MFKRKITNEGKTLNRISDKDIEKRGVRMSSAKRKTDSNERLFDDVELEALYKETKELFKESKILGKFNFLF